MSDFLYLPKIRFFNSQDNNPIVPHNRGFYFVGKEKVLTTFNDYLPSGLLFMKDKILVNAFLFQPVHFAKFTYTLPNFSHRRFATQALSHLDYDSQATTNKKSKNFDFLNDMGKV